MDYKEYFKNLKGKTIGVFGMGVSNLPLIEMLINAGALVVAGDKKTFESLSDDAKALKDKGVKLVLGDDFPDKMEGEILFRTPGLRPDIKRIKELQANGSVLTSEMEVFFELCPAEIIAVTGSDGKTTTTTLISEMLKTEGYKTWLGGNIGTPLLPEIKNISADDKVVVELSSFQLFTFKKSPHIAVITNLSPNHLDVHKDYKEYIDAKKNIMLYQSEDDILVVNGANEETIKIGKCSNAKVRTFSAKERALTHLSGDIICYGDEQILDARDIKIPGLHNVENYMTAICAVHDMVSADTIRKVAKTFGGVQHRIELVREKDGIKFYNSSIDSSPNRTINTLKVFKDRVILITGGKDKGIPYDEIGPHIIDKVKTLVLIGATAPLIEDALNKAYIDQGIEPFIDVFHAKSYEQAVNLAYNNAKENDVVLLSPASTSFDMFKNFEERGNCFKELVMKL